jgi:hypothetical protein
MTLHILPSASLGFFILISVAIKRFTVAYIQFMRRFSLRNLWLALFLTKDFKTYLLPRLKTLFRNQPVETDNSV